MFIFHEKSVCFDLPTGYDASTGKQSQAKNMPYMYTAVCKFYFCKDKFARGGGNGMVTAMDNGIANSCIEMHSHNELPIVFLFHCIHNEAGS
jgi:hypothetical protein